MRVIIAGSRTFNAFERAEKELDDLLWDKGLSLTILSGGASGADHAGEIWARKRHHYIEMHPADWEVHGKAAGPIRNKEMAENADMLIAFWDGKSKGTKNMIEEAEKRGLVVKVIRI